MNRSYKIKTFIRDMVCGRILILKTFNKINIDPNADKATLKVFCGCTMTFRIKFSQEINK